MAQNVRESKNLKLYVDGIFIASGTEFNIDRSKSVERTDVIGSDEQRISEGTIEITGSLTELKSNDLGFKLVRSASLRNAKSQGTYYDGAGDVETGTAAIQHTLATGNLTVEQQFTAIGTRVDHIRLLLKRNASFVEDITLQFKTLADANVGSAITVTNGQIDAGSPFWTEIDLGLDAITGFTKDTQYKLVITAPATSGELYWYGNERQPKVLLLTATGGETDVDLLHDSVESSTLFVQLNDYVQGQEEGYTFGDGTGTGGLDKITFTTPLTAGDLVYAAYEFDDGVENPGAWRIVFGGVTAPTYSIVINDFDSSGNLRDSYTINNVTFDSIGRNISPNSFVDRTLSFSGESETSINI